MELYLIRHAESEYNVGQTTNLDSPLTPLGQKQAARTAARLADGGITQIYVSPLRRTLLTAQPICAATHLRAQVYAEVCEFFSENNTGYHDFQGLSPEEIARDFPWVEIGSAFPCAAQWWPRTLENPQALIERAERARDALLCMYGDTDQKLLVISHADTVGRLMEAFLRVDPYPFSPPWLENCSVTRLHCYSDPAIPAELVYANDVSHLGNLVHDPA